MQMIDQSSKQDKNLKDGEYYDKNNTQQQQQYENKMEDGDADLLPSFATNTNKRGSLGGDGHGGFKQQFQSTSTAPFRSTSVFEPMPFDEQEEAGLLDRSQSQKDRINRDMAPTEWDETNTINERVQFSEQQNIKCSIEIKNGIPQRSLNNFHKNQNALVLNNYTGIWGLVIFFYETIFQFDHMILVVHFCSQAISGQRVATDYSHVIFIAIASVIATGCLNLMHDRKLKQAAEKVNSKPVEKFIFSKRHKSFQLSDWGSIQTGDIIKIKSSQEIPCDALILNIVGSKLEHQTCYQRGSLWDDLKAPSLKRSYQGTMNKTGSYQSDSKFADQISGLIKWEYNHQGYFTGDFKQIDNPAAFEIQPLNIVQRGCFVSNCQFMVCLALNVGLQTMGNGFRSPEQLQNRIKNSLLQKNVVLHRPEGVQFRALRSMQIFSIIFCLVPCILVLFEDFALRKTSMGLFAESLDLLGQGETWNKARFMFDVMAGFMINLPYLSHIVMEAVVYFHAYFVLWDINLVPANINFTNLRTMKTLGQVDTIICSKSAFLNANIRYVTAFKVSDQLCYNQDESKRQQMNGEMANDVQSLNSSEASDDDDQETLEYLPNQTQIQNYFQSSTATQMLERSHPRYENFQQFLLALTLCHHATTQKYQQGQQQASQYYQTYKSLYREEESQLQFAETYGYQFKIRNNRMLTIYKQGSLQRFDEMIIRKIRYQGDWLTVQVIKTFQTFQSGATIYYKGNLRILQKLIKMNPTTNFESDIDKFCKEGIHAIGLAKREIEADEAVELSRILQDNASQKESDDKNDAFLINLAVNLDLIGVLGMKNATNTRDALLMEELRKNGVKLFLLSTDVTADNITDMNALKLFNNYRHPLNVTGKTDRQVQESLKNCLKQLIEKRMVDPADKIKDQDQSVTSNVGRLTATPTTSKVKKNSKTVNGSISSSSFTQVKRDSSLVEFFDQDQKSSVFVNGNSLQFILKDETLTKLFLTLCSLCTLVVGSSVTPYQKRDLTAAIRQFSIQGKQGYVVSVVASQADKFTSLEADITVGISRSYQQSDLLACSDVQMRDIYGISYLLFKHGTILHRRLRVVLNEFLYRTILLSMIQLFFFIMSGFSTVLPYGSLYFATHVALISPIQYFVEGIMHTDYGYEIFHRIFGEYKFNKGHSLSILDFSGVILSSIVDAMLFCLFYAFVALGISQDFLIASNGMNLAWQSSTSLNSILLALFQYWRNRSTICSVKTFMFTNFFLSTISLAFIAEDDRMAGMDKLVNSPYQIGTIVFIWLCLILKWHVRQNYTFMYPRNKLRVERYQIIEDRLFMEEYEDPEQQFEISDSVNFPNLVRQIEETKLFSINQNLLKVHRSDSMDQILDRINISGGQTAEGRSNFTNRSMINKFNLKLNDINKEIEYNQVSISDSQIKNYVSLIWTSTFLYSIIGMFKIFNQALENNENTSTRNDTTTQNRSDTAGNTISTIYIEVLEVLVSLLAIYVIKKVKSIRSDLVIFSLVVIFNIMVNIYFLLDPDNPLIQIQFLYTIAFSHLIRLNSVFFVSLICMASAIGFLNIRLSTIEDSNEKSVTAIDYSIQLVWQALAVTMYVFFWTYYTYWDEIKQKVRFVTQFRDIKELQKLKSIINILIPSLVRSRIQDGKKNFSETQGEVTVIFVDIEGFDQVVQQYTGRELIELLDRVYNAFDSFCEQHGLQKIETVGKTYMACGGLKVIEKDVDNRLLGSHHSVRATDFACSIQSYVHTQTLRNQKKLIVKIGIHTGEAIAGVVGETKPQFSLIGPTINKTARVCSKCPPGRILISKETHANLLASASNFVFGSIKIEMKGIGTEEVFTVQKRRVQQSKLIGQRRDVIRKEEHNENPINKRDGQGSSYNNQKNEKQGSYNQDEDQNMETSRSVDFSGFSERMSSVQNDTDRDQKSLNEDSFEDEVAGNILKKNELKDDKQIVKSAAQNDRYNLVERPRFLISFELKDQEQAFLHSLLKQNYSLEVFQLVSKSIIDLIIIECLVYTFFGEDSYMIYIGVFFAQAAVEAGILYYMKRLTSQGIMVFLVIQIIGIATSMVFFILNGPKFQNFLIRSSQQVTLGIYQAIIVISRAIPFRVFASVQIILYIALISQNYFFIELQVLNLQTYVIDSVLQLVLFALLILASHSREMKVRRQYNQQRIIEVEIEKTEDLLGKLVPLHVLAGIKNDQKVVDSLDNVTLLYTDMVGFTEFSKNTKPQEVVSLLSRLFSKFDQLCEQIGVYKVHTIGDCYVIMSYTGKIAKERRSPVIQIEEAFRVIQVGLEMINVIAEERSNTKNPSLRNLDMRIGIHTGKIVGGIIGTKVVRYDIFGQDVLIANKMESNGMAGAVCISEQTYKLINKNKVIAEIFDFKEHRSCSIDTIGKNIKSYIVSQNLNAMGESSEDYSEDGAEEDYEDGEQHSDNSQSNEGYEHDLYSASRQSMSNPDDSIRQDSEKL